MPSDRAAPLLWAHHGPRPAFPLQPAPCTPSPHSPQPPGRKPTATGRPGQPRARPHLKVEQPLRAGSAAPAPDALGGPPPCTSTRIRRAGKRSLQLFQPPLGGHGGRRVRASSARGPGAARGSAHWAQALGTQDRGQLRPGHKARCSGNPPNGSGRTKASVSRERWTCRPQRTYFPPSPGFRKKHFLVPGLPVPGPGCSPSTAVPATPSPAPVCVRTSGSAGVWLHLPALLLVPGQNTSIFPKEVTLKAYSWGVPDAEQGPHPKPVLPSPRPSARPLPSRKMAPEAPSPASRAPGPQVCMPRLACGASCWVNPGSGPDAQGPDGTWDHSPAQAQDVSYSQ